jgi:hypothetical protein
MLRFALVSAPNLQHRVAAVGEVAAVDGLEQAAELVVGGDKRRFVGSWGGFMPTMGLRSSSPWATHHLKTACRLR